MSLDDLASLTPDLASLGWDDELDRWASTQPPGRPGRLARVSRGFSLVFTGGAAELAASGSGRADTGDAPATGDYVLVSDDGDGDDLVIAAIAPRRTALERRAPGRVPTPQVLATNIDGVLVMHGLDRPLNKRRLERQLVVAWDSGATPTVVLTKADTADDIDPMLDEVAAAAPGADVIAVSTVDGRGLAEVMALLDGGRTLAMLGLSGIGKSTLVNALSDGQVQRTGEVRATDLRGRHTTVTRDLVPLPSGGFVIDTPGVREIGLWQSYDGLDRAFPEIAAAAAECRFANCDHDGEPGCGVAAAMAAGSVHADRLDHWHQLSEELALQETQLEEFARRAENRERADAEDERDNTRRKGRSSGRGRGRGGKGRRKRRG